MAVRRKIVAGNWKLNGTRSTVVELAKAVAEGSAGLETDIVVCPTIVHLAEVAPVLQESLVKLGAQNCSDQDTGAFTGECSAQMMVEYGCEYIILGHSERRALFAESSQWVAEKCAAVQAAGATPILCVGETLEERESGKMESVIFEQLDAAIDRLGVDAFARLIVAYEPVWAIGTGVTATPEQAQAVHAMIRKRVQASNDSIADGLQILYGGSVKPDNANALFSQPDIDGGLIGGAALQADSFLSICQAAS